jgi:hypothetical protein
MQFNPKNFSNDFDPNDISDDFWLIIEKANKDRTILKNILLEKDRNSIYKFAGEFSEAALQIVDSPFIEYLGELSEYNTYDVGYWIVSQGRELYQNILNRPELISNYQDAHNEETFSGVAENVYEERFDEEMPDLYEFGWPIFHKVNL